MILAQEPGGDPSRFEGKLNHDNLFRFLEPHAAPPPVLFWFLFYVFGDRERGERRNKVKVKKREY